MTDIVKDFPGVRALKGVQLKVRPGTVHTLMGENGAGKSTLMKCLIGIHPPTSGKIVFDGKEIHFKTTLEALNSGISMIHQELSPVPERSVSENLWLGRAPRKGLIIDHKKMRQDSIDLFQRLQGSAALTLCVLEYGHSEGAVLDSLTAVSGCVDADDRNGLRVQTLLLHCFDCAECHCIVVGDYD